MMPGTSTTLSATVVSAIAPDRSVAVMRTALLALMRLATPVMRPLASMLRPGGRPVAVKRRLSLLSTSVNALAALSTNSWFNKAWALAGKGVVSWGASLTLANSTLRSWVALWPAPSLSWICKL